MLADRGLPLLTTETNRRHRTLRRLLASGASLIAPYLQSSGWNFGYTPSTGNRGQPGNFMSHGYDFGGYVSSTGVERPEYAEAQVFARVIDTLRSRLALPTSTVPRVRVVADFPTSSSLSALDLHRGGQLIAVPNLGEAAGRAVVGGVSVAVAADSCPLMLVDLPLQDLGLDATLTLTSADLVAATGRVLVFSSEVPATVVLDGHQVEIPAPTTGAPERTMVEGLSLVVLTPSDAARLRGIGRDGKLDLASVPGRQATTRSAVVRAVRRRSGAAPAEPAGTHDLPPTLESLGVYRGRGTYTTTTDLTGVDELLLVGAADIVDLSIAGRVHPTITGFAATQRIDVRDVMGSAEIHATVEIWGHANFDDARLPALRLGALRGLGTLWTVQSAQDLSALWTVDGHWAGVPAPLRMLGGWSSTRGGAPITYTRRIESPTRSALNLQGVVEPVSVTVDDGEPITVHTENSWVMLPAGTSQVSVTLPHHPSGGGLRAELLHVEPVTDWSCTVQDDNLLTAFASEDSPAEDVELPLTLKPGQEAWLDVDLAASETGFLLRLDGSQLRATGWASGECLGRIWVGDRPAFSGGDPDVLWVPPVWSGLTLLLRGVDGPGEPELRTLRLEPPSN